MREMTYSASAFQDMGVMPAAICLLETLKPTADNMYKAKLYGKQQEEASQAASNYIDFDLDIHDAKQDAW